MDLALQTRVRLVRTESFELSIFDLSTGERQCYLRSLSLIDLIEELFPTAANHLLENGQEVEADVSTEMLMALILATREVEQKKDEKVIVLDKILRELHKLHLKEERYLKKAKHRYPYNDTLEYMDGSVRQWLTIILTAERDFLAFNNDLNRWDNEDYITARSLLFRDDYEIDIGKGVYVEGNGKKSSASMNDTGEGVYVNLRDLLEYLIAAMETMKLSVSVRKPTVERIRHYMAKTSGDPSLMERFCKPELEISGELDFGSLFQEELASEEEEEVVLVGSSLEDFELFEEDFGFKYTE